ncbi:SRPBCC domain-containing protein [Fictibacillus aquaticus]|uniref:Activator of Hsp90 ATPase homologue 1/2-like C-terminal domain-containing protein n=1 Tax=Fictibacillus aquaticus TaxID=2021314 RepID=A0A235F809_9BACL|nr:SRPBCC family protein [Fictibacillus aquaticus]OYD57117.1 hypothetical protein CGZ90_10490 [Fictibacillus aquaticus]
MRSDLIVSRSIDINAAALKVWEALTEPEKIKEYLFGTEITTDWKEGSDILFEGEYEGKEYQDKGTVLTNLIEEKIRYTYWSSFSGVEDKPDNYSVVTYELSELNRNLTKLTWTQKGYASEEGYNHSNNVIDSLLFKIKKIAER